jgi:hypothetical protein
MVPWVSSYRAGRMDTAAGELRLGHAGIGEGLSDVVFR